MAHYRFLVESRPRPGFEEKYHHWYDGRHSEDLLDLPGAQTVQRFTTVRAQDGLQSYFMIVDYETDDLNGLLATIQARSGTPDMPSSDAIDRDSVRVTVLEARWPPRSR